MGANFLTRALGFVDVSEDDKYITIGGVKAENIGKDILRLWGTNRIEQNMFNEIGGRIIRFPKFFGPEVHYILGKILSTKNVATSRGAIKDALTLLEQNTWMKRINQEYDSILNLDALKLFKKTPMPHQMNFFQMYSHRTQAYGLNGYLLSAGAGTGKEQPLSCKIKVPGGWKYMGEMQPGDIVTAWDGTPAKVTNVYPQGEKDVYVFTFKDGRTTRCGAEHLWRVYNNSKRPHLQMQVVNTLEVMAMMGRGERCHIDLASSEQGPDIDLPVDPYLLGVILGDGGLTTGRVTITKGDEELFDHIKEVLPPDLKLSQIDELTQAILSKDTYWNSLNKALRDLKLMGARSDLKWIPEIYFSASTHQRLELLRGLMDTDGTVDKKTATPSYCTTSPVLAKDVQRLIWSLGGIAKMGHRQPSFTYDGVKKLGKPAFVISIRIKQPSTIFKLSRKKLLTNDQGQYLERLKLGIVSVELSHRELCQCIAIDHPDHLYVTDHHIVTHNTLMACMLGEMLGADYKIMVCPKNAAYRVWAGSLADEYKDPRKAWIIADGKPYEGQHYIVCHYEGLDKLKAIASRINGSVIIPLDESHNLNSDDSLRTQYFIDICRSFKQVHVLWMSGTPVKALGYESIPLLRSIDPLFTDEVEARFKKIYGRDATKALDILRQRFGMISFHVESSAVVTNETSTHTQMIKIPNGQQYTLDAVRAEMQKFIEERLKYYMNERKSYRKIYERALDIYEDTIETSEDKRAFKIYKRYIDMISAGFDPMSMAKEAKYCNHFEKNIIAPTLPKDLKKAFMSAKSVVKYPQLKVLGEALGGVLSKKRVQCHLDMIPYMNLEKIIDGATKKTIIFSSYVEVVDAIAKYLKGKGFDPITVHANSGQELAASVNQFFKDPKLNPLVATYQSLSTAVPIICANCTVFTNMPFREYEITQARARTNRLGQDTPVEYYNTFLDTGKEPNVSTRSRDILEWSRQQVAAILGQDYGGTITAEMVNAMEAQEEDFSPFQISVAMEEYADF